MKLIGLLLLSMIGFSQKKLTKISFLNDKVEILAPKELSRMTDEMWALKYQKRVRPMLVLTDQNGEVDLIANMSQQVAEENQVASIKDAQIQQLRKSRPDFKLLEDGIKIINEKKIGYFKFLIQAVDQKVFGYQFFIIVDGKILLFNFNCIEKLQNTWEKSVNEIVASLKTK